jgi:hypothetical protein
MSDGEAPTPSTTKTTIDATARAITSGVIQIGLSLFSNTNHRPHHQPFLKRLAQVN